MATAAGLVRTLDLPAIRDVTAPPMGGHAHSREWLLHRLWIGQRLLARPLPADDGSRIQVVFPGWANPDRGPDFRGAILATEQGHLLKGDVEIHVHARDWQTHGHHLDPHYDGVVLHVAWRGERPPSLHAHQAGGKMAGSRPGGARTSSGGAVPTVCLEGLLETPLEVALLAGAARESDARPCVRHAPDPDRVGEWLDREGDQRFLAKSAALAGNAAALGEEQALYHGLLDALGYSKNRAPFCELASLVPFRYLQEIAQGKPPGRRGELLRAVLLGAAGLLADAQGTAPRSSPDDRAVEQERLWRAHASIGVIRSPWQAFRIRPENSPKRRVVAAAALVERYIPSGLVDGLLTVIGSGDARQDRRALRQALMTAEGGISQGDGRRALLGAGRAGDLAVNVVLPFFHAWARERRDDSLAGRCLDIYHAFPPLPDNHITRDMQRLLLPAGARETVTSARRQQGLLSLYRRQCADLACQGCALGARNARPLPLPARR